MRLIAIAVLAVALAAPVRADDPPAPGVCFNTEKDFIDSAVRVNKAKVMTASPRARDVILDSINEART